VRKCLTDEGRPLGIGLQERIPNPLRRLWPKGCGRERGRKRPGLTGSGVRQEEDRKETTVEVPKPTSDDVKTAAGLLLRDRASTKPVYGRSGIRHERWPELAMRRISGT
jgi:hypothetical protein